MEKQFNPQEQILARIRFPRQMESLSTFEEMSEVQRPPFSLYPRSYRPPAPPSQLPGTWISDGIYQQIIQRQAMQELLKQVEFYREIGAAAEEEALQSEYVSYY